MLSNPFRAFLRRLNPPSASRRVRRSSRRSASSIKASQRDRFSGFAAETLEERAATFRHSPGSQVRRRLDRRTNLHYRRPGFRARKRRGKAGHLREPTRLRQLTRRK